MSWTDVIEEVVKRKAIGKKAGLLSEDEGVDSYTKKLPKKRVLAVYKLGAKYGDMYFTKREAECMVWLLRGKTINGVATILQLSPRTVEYYIKNMKIKVGCRTKFELIDLVYASEFVRNLDFAPQNYM